MKKIYLACLAVCGIVTVCKAQNTFPSTGNVGIGTMSPLARLHILKNGSYGDAGSTNTTVDNLLVLQTPYVSSAPGSYTGAGYKWGIKFWSREASTTMDDTKTAGIYAVSEDQGTGYNRSVGIAFHTSPLDAHSVERLRITNNGNVGIGTTDPHGFKLAVAGSSIAESMTVKLQANWPDYVFKNDHQLKPLSEVKNYIDQNKHLPEVPSEAEVAKDGINLGEMNKLLLKKVEELTLYLIEKDKQLKDQEAINKALDERLKAIEQKLIPTVK